MTFGNISLANRTWMYIISEFLYMFPDFLLKYKQKFQKLGKMKNILIIFYHFYIPKKSYLPKSPCCKNKHTPIRPARGRDSFCRSDHIR